MSGHRDAVRALSDELVTVQRPIRVLDALAWDGDVREAFFAGGCRRQPAVDADYYRHRRPLRFDAEATRRDLADLAGRIERRLGRSAIGGLLAGRVAEYHRVLDLLDARGTAAFPALSVELYGSAGDLLHPGGPTVASLGEGLGAALAAIDAGSWEPPEEKVYDAAGAVEVLQARLDPLFGEGDDRVRVILDDGIVADAAAGSDYIKLRGDAVFSERDLRVLEVHEGWVHVATSLNGRAQPWCTFLGKGTPSTTATQEGLAVFTELTTLSSTPDRLATITRRMAAIEQAEHGASFVEVFDWLLGHGLDRDGAWNAAVRVFRGSTPTGGPFTKDLVYSRGLIEVYNLARRAVQRGLLDRLPLLFVGKLAVRELPLVAELHDEGLIAPPAHLPPQVADLRALSALLAYAHVLHQIDLATVEEELDQLL